MPDEYQVDPSVGIVPDPDHLPKDTIDEFKANDAGNGERLVDLKRDVIRYVEDTDQWLIWDGMRWKPDTGTAILRHAIEVAREVQGRLPAEVKGHSKEAEATRAAVVRWCNRSLDEPRLKAAINNAKADARIIVQSSDLDTQVAYLNTPGGVYDMANGAVLKHDPALMITKITLGNPAGAADMSRPDGALWASLLGRWQPDATLRAWLQALMAGSAIGRSSERLVIHRGGGLNGKSRFLDANRAALGDYALATRSELLTGTSRNSAEAPTPALMALRNVRLAAVDELDEGAVLNSMIIKQLCGGSVISARQLYGQEVTYTPTADIHTMTNHEPAVTDASHGAWRRLVLAPWPVRIPEDEKDESLIERVRSQTVADQVVAWLIRGAEMLFSTGMPDTPAEVASAQEEYRLANDDVQNFLNTCNVISVHEDPEDPAFDTYTIASATLWDCFQSWWMSHNQNTREMRLTDQKFYRDLAVKGYRAEKRNGERVRVGIKARFGGI